MLRTGSLSGPLLAAAVLLPFALAGNALLAFGLAREALVPTLAVASLPAALLLFGALTASHRHVLVYAGLALNMTAAPLTRPILGGIHVADVIVVLAFGSWLAWGLLRMRTGERPSWPDTPVLGWPLALFGAAIALATVRGHELYGSPLFGQPLRLIAYAAIAGAIAGTNPRQMYRGIVAVVYAATVWMFLNALYHLATGTSQTDNFGLSTGGTRVLSLTVSLYLAVALLLALLNLQVEQSAGRRFVHIAIASLAAVGAILGYGRGVYLAVALVLPLVIFGVRRVRSAVASVVPFLLPFVLVGVILVPRVMPEAWSTFVDRVTAPQAEDRNIRFRQATTAASLEHFHESPAIGVGFGRDISFDLDGKRYDLRQGSHNSLAWLLSGAGALGLGAFAILFAAFVHDAWRRLRGAVDPRERVLITWSVAALTVIIIDAATIQLLTAPPTLLTIWILLLLPTVVPRRPPAASTSSRVVPR